MGNCAAINKKDSGNNTNTKNDFKKRAKAKNSIFINKERLDKHKS
jgi:hypothetical protein